MDFSKSTTQALQTLTSLALTIYIAFLAALGKQLDVGRIPTPLLMLPIFLFLASLLVSFAFAALYRGESLPLTTLYDGAWRAGGLSAWESGR